MATVNKSSTVIRRTDVARGALAIGSHGAWQIDIDEALSCEQWWMQIEGPSVCLYFEIPSTEIVGKMARFLAARTSKSKRSANGSAKKGGNLLLGVTEVARVSLVKDDEFDDRYFLVIGPTEALTIHWTIAGKDVAEIAVALRRAWEQLDDS